LNLKFEVTHAVATHSIVISGLDPVIHHSSHAFSKKMDGRVKPGHDELEIRRNARRTHDVVPAKAGTHNHRTSW
jgi:hypothetical protein